MQLTRTRGIERGLDAIFQQAGISLTWYQYSGTASGGLPEFGHGITVTYYTSYIVGLLIKHTPRESQLPGGASEQGMLDIRSREAIGTHDIIGLDSDYYRVQGAPRRVILGPTLFYAAQLIKAS